ncbi:endo-beta-N-acetylglucosaminidase [Spiroplasma endosymbiont of Dioctria linearis]|uniref:endo-beta-N-acetylglucosaminidase n=1 Tax=Spiroplasma endosymbiont of Dioctria linearis TaxID=3066290 RepID=UPI00313CD497
MKKIVFTLLSVTIVIPFLVYTVSCGNNKFNYGTDLSKISDYNWKKEEPYYDKNKRLLHDIPSSVSDEGIKLKIEERNRYLNYKYLNTGFKTVLEVLKQVPTGVPLNSKFLPNGNRKKDIMEIKRNEIFDKVNSILEWNYKSDLDAKYNKSRIELQKRTNVASKWVETQDEKIQQMNMTTIINSTSNENTIIGNKRTYSRSFNNYQYNDIMVSWAGSADEGIIIPPGKNEVEKAHLNGTKILGNIFLDGYHGLKKETLEKFLKRDAQGNYLIVDILINMAVNLAFDGWFWNNEPNGYFEDGYILNYKTVIEIMKQWNEKVKSSKDERINKLVLFSYKNNGNLELDSTGKTASQESEALHKNTDYFLSDFGITTNKSLDYIKKNKIEKSSHKIFNMYNLGGWINGKIFYDKNKIGQRDLRDLVYKHFDENGNEYKASDVSKEREDKNNNKWTYIKNGAQQANSYNSLAIFAAHTASDLAQQEMDKINNAIPNQESDIYGMTLQNYYDDMIYTGKNRQLSIEDKGSVSYDESTFNDYLSYGVGNLVNERTVLNDFNKSFFTNFSTGNGSKFALLNEKKERIIEENYPWSNTNIADVQPTYKWMILQNNGIGKTQQIDKETDITGYYDYLNPYLKGNSIALGSKKPNSIKINGEIEEATFDPNKSYNWMIMGSNYTDSKPLTVSIVYKSNYELSDESIVYEEIKSNNSNIRSSSNINIRNLDEGWKEVTTTITPSMGIIGKIGLQFKSSNKKNKINIGQLAVNSEKINQNLEDISQLKAQSELLIDRGNNYQNIRLNFENLLKDNDIYSYYEVYFKEKNKLVRVGETNSNDYFVRDIPSDTNELYIKIQNNATKEVKWIKFKLEG